MSQTQELSEIVCDTEVPNEEGTLSVPLFFILSPALLHPHSASHQYSRLPPSCKIGPEYKTSLDGSFMQPLIKYDVCARVDFCFTPGGPLWCVESSCPFEVATAAYVDPPIYCEDSDLHFLAQATHVVRRTPLSAPCGKVAARMAEPTPLGAAGSDGVRSTKGELEISWSSFGSDRSNADQAQWKIEITCFLDTWTPISTRSSRQPSSSHQAHELGLSRLVSRRQALGSYDTRLSPAEITQLNEERKGGKIDLYRLLLPIVVSNPVLPTFATPFAARWYTIAVCVEIYGTHCGKLWVTAPLQINESGSSPSPRPSLTEAASVSSLSSTLPINLLTADH